MNKKKFFAFDAIRFSFTIFYEHFYFMSKLFSLTTAIFVGIILLTSLTSFGLDIKSNSKIMASMFYYILAGCDPTITDESPHKNFIFFGVSLIYIFFFLWRIMGSKIGFMLYDKKRLSLKEIIFSLKKTLTCLGFAFASSCVGMIGWYIFPMLGLFIDARLKLGICFIIDKETDTIDTFKNSWNISKKHIWDILLLTMTIMLIVFIGSQLINEWCKYMAYDLIAIAISSYAMFAYAFLSASAYGFLFRKIYVIDQIQATPENILHQDYNQLPKSPQQQLQP